ncbi:hypothetical protein ABH920_002324 [Catenulispora sp. EB89]|uniref:hypothetical protein n=1 Tax=Catenulispora sp. EB89 TaxID=3156257 RepID=UPI0035179356
MPATATTTAIAPAPATATATATPAPASGIWVLSAPDSVTGLKRVQPPAATLKTIMTTLQQAAGPLGVENDNPVVGVYDDPQYDVYIVVAGYNGTGFDPAKLTAAESVPPSFQDVNGTRFTNNHVTIDPGDHGGTAGCTSTLGQSGAMAAEATGCMWMTMTTFGGVTYVPKPDLQQMVYGIGPDKLGPIMRTIRAQVERRG